MSKKRRESMNAALLMKDNGVRAIKGPKITFRLKNDKKRPMML